MVGTVIAAKQASTMGRRSVKHPVISVTKMIPVTGARTTAVKNAAMPTTAKAVGRSPRYGNQRQKNVPRKRPL
jgi:hypothetical protein